MTEKSETYQSFRSNKAKHITRYAPYSLLDVVPWLLLATILRMNMKVAPGALALLLLPLVQIVVFIAFLLASEKMIALSRGHTSLAELTINAKARFAWQVIWRLLLLFLVSVLLAIGIGVSELQAATMWMGFDGLAFPWRQDPLQAWVAFISIVAFVFVLEKGGGRDPKYLNIVRRLYEHRRSLFTSWVYISLFLMLATYVQGRIALLAGYLLSFTDLASIERVALIGYIAAFSYLRIWVVVAILTVLLRASYGRLGVKSQQERK